MAWRRRLPNAQARSETRRGEGMAVPGERSGMDGDAVGAAGPPSTPLAGNADIVGWMDVLLKGKPEEQVLARTEIAMLLEERGHAADAEDAYWTNVQAR